MGSTPPGGSTDVTLRAWQEPLGSSSPQASVKAMQSKDDEFQGSLKTSQGRPVMPRPEPGQEEMEVNSEDDPGIIIKMVLGEEQAWITEGESDDSLSSTPSYRRGNHHQGELKILQMIHDDAQKFRERPRQY